MFLSTLFLAIAAIGLQSLIVVVIALVIVGFVLYLINTKLPMDGTVKLILNFVVILAIVLWLLNYFSVV